MRIANRTISSRIPDDASSAVMPASLDQPVGDLDGDLARAPAHLAAEQLHVAAAELHQGVRGAFKIEAGLPGFQSSTVLERAA